MKEIEYVIQARALVVKLSRGQAQLNAVLAMLVRVGAVDEEQWGRAVAFEPEKLVGLRFEEIVEAMDQAGGPTEEAVE